MGFNQHTSHSNPTQFQLVRTNVEKYSKQIL